MMARKISFFVLRLALLWAIAISLLVAHALSAPRSQFAVPYCDQGGYFAPCSMKGVTWSI